MSERKLSPEDGGAKDIARFNILQAIGAACTATPTAPPTASSTLPTQSPHQPQVPEDVVDEHLTGVRKIIQEESKFSLRSPPPTALPRPPRSPRISPTNSPPASRYTSSYAAINYVPHYPHDGLGWGNWWGNVTLLLEVCALLYGTLNSSL